MEIAPTGSPIVMAATDVAPAGSCGHPESVTYGPRKRSDDDTLAGIVINLYPKMPIAGATLQLLDAAGAQIAQQQTNERGEFQFKQIAPGRYHIAFQQPGYNNTKSFEFWVARENQRTSRCKPCSSASSWFVSKSLYCFFSGNSITST